MKKIKILAITIAIIFSTVYALNLEYFIKGIRVVYLNGQTTVFIDDLKYFDYETIMANDEKFPWNESENLVDTFSDEFEQINKEFGTVAYVVIHKDTIIAEKYYKGYSSNSSSNSFIKILSGSGIFVALSMFFLNGVEEVPFPEGAVVFHAEGIAQALFLLFLCSIPIVLKLIPENTIILNNSIDTKSNSRDIKGKNQSEDWEEATIEDLESGEFETL